MIASWAARPSMVSARMPTLSRSGTLRPSPGLKMAVSERKRLETQPITEPSLLVTCHQSVEPATSHSPVGISWLPRSIVVMIGCAAPGLSRRFSPPSGSSSSTSTKWPCSAGAAQVLVSTSSRTSSSARSRGISGTSSVIARLSGLSERLSATDATALEFSTAFVVAPLAHADARITTAMSWANRRAVMSEVSASKGPV